MGVVREFLRDIFDKGLRNMNDEINAGASAHPIQPRQAQDGDTDCGVRAGFENLKAFLTGEDVPQQSSAPRNDGGMR